MPIPTIYRICVHHCITPAVGLLLVALLAGGCSQKQTRAGGNSNADGSTAKRKKAKAEEVAPSMGVQAFRDAAFQGRIETVRQAIEQGVDVNASDADGRTALLLTSYEGNTDVVRLLLEHDAAMNHRDAAGRTALMYAASGANHETVSVLLKAGADPDVVDKEEGFTALMFAAAEGQKDVVKALLGHNANVKLRDIDGDTAMDFAAKNGHDAIASMLEQ